MKSMGFLCIGRMQCRSLQTVVSLNKRNPLKSRGYAVGRSRQCAVICVGGEIRAFC